MNMRQIWKTKKLIVETHDHACGVGSDKNKKKELRV